MLDESLMDQIRADAKRRYTSLSNPNFSFIQKIWESRPYDPIIEEIGILCRLEDITDVNYDVSFQYVLRFSDTQWILELSMVGPYFILRPADGGGGMDGAHPDIVERCREKGLTRLDYDEAKALNIDGNKCLPSEKSIYEWLFYNDPDLGG